MDQLNRLLCTWLDWQTSMSLADQYFGLLKELEELFGCKVDLLTRRSLRNPYFVDSVEKTRQLLYAA